MSNTLSYIIQINENFDKVNSSFNKFQSNVHSGIDRVQRQLNGLRLNNLIQNISSAADGLNSLNDPGLKLSSSLSDLSAITGVTGDKLKEIEGYARQNANTFGGAASESAESYKLILSQLTPEIAKVPSALKAMGKEASVTSKLMGGDTAAATSVLTTAMNQYQVSMADPIKASKEMAKMNNVMAASAKEGSAELPQIAQALEQSGLAAKTANVSFEETNAFIQVLDKNGKKGAEGGVALRNVMATLAQGRFLPKDVKTELRAAGVDINRLTDNSISLSERLKPLKGIMTDQALVTKLFGKENSNAAIAMIAGITEAERLTIAVTGTNTAYEQAAIIMESPLEKNKRLQAQIDDFKITLFNGTNGLMGYASVLGQTAHDFANLMPIMSGAGKVFSTLTSATKLQALWTGIVSGATSVWTGVQMAFNAVMAMNPIVWIVIGVMALVAAIAWVATSTTGWGNAWKHTITGAKLIFTAYVELVKAQFNTVVNGIMIGINKIQIAWYKFKNMAGLGDKGANNAEISKLNAEVEARKASIKGGYQKAASTAVAAGAEFKAAFDSVKWKKESKKGESGITDPGLVGTDLGKGGASGSGAGGGSASAKKSNEAVATGGTKHTYVTINLKELIGIKTESISGGKDTANKAGNEVADELMRLLAMATTAGG
ncbi:phage tail tape measure protein [Flavobacterium branchiarum]|uniref:Phage tail tape measure protein n=1 Tax=Flavobacterium branchiarum TaxID=1114870 RepID=A0ABV5FRZ1_9FLAO|nr:phage tail tape measure protein [Flavobacterium branchiarum]MDN3671695.1 phage tail tape measure protein [Flavobacterium branchiarum]